MDEVFRDISEPKPFTYDFLMVDPPWSFKTYSSSARSTASKYKVMETSDILALPVSQLAKPDALVWLWAINPMLDKAFEAFDRWGVEFKTAGHWVKYNEETGKLANGGGYWFRGAGEPYLLGTIGKPKVRSRQVRSVIMARRRGHSEKPEQCYTEAEKMWPEAKRIELFSRKPRKGWDVMGDEL